MSPKIAATDEDAPNEQAEAVRELALPLLELAANILRIVRGSGRAEQVAQQCSAVVQQFIEYRNVVGRLPTDQEVADALRLPGGDLQGTQRLERRRAVDKIVLGALQVAASALLDQAAQQARGEAEVTAGARALLRSREKQRPAGDQAQPKRPAAETRTPIGRVLQGSPGSSS